MSFCCFAGVSFSLTPDQVLVLANGGNSDSLRLAEYYMIKRGIPASHLVTLALSDGESCSRKTYDRDVVPSIRKHLEKTGLESRIRCLVTLYGLPLRVEGPRRKVTGDERLGILRDRLRFLERKLIEQGSRFPEKKKGLEDRLERLRMELTKLTLKNKASAAFDSELALVLEKEYPLVGWVLNPFFIGFRGERRAEMPRRVLMVARLDASSPDHVKRMIDDAMKVEKEGGLRGTAYFDARYPPPARKENGKREKTDLYAIYDHALHKAAQMIRRTGIMPVVLDDKPGLFQPGQCPDAALYCGWYSLGRYVDAFTWRPGAVGYHIASGECTTLKKRGSQVWCKKMIETGVAATLGPVDEPFLSAFPPPDLFFTLLLDGRWTLAECYALSQPFWSWKMVLIGDPLYRPFPRG